MADVQPLRALRYEPAVAGPLADVVAPPYDVIDPEQRARLAARSPYNVVHVDLPEGGADPYAAAAATLHGWQREGAVVREPDPALWALRQDYEAPGEALHRTRSGFLCRVRIEDYGPGRIRPHERTHPGPREDRLRLTRATRTNLSAIFSLYDDPAGAAWGALAPHASEEPWDEVTEADGTVHRLWRIADPAAIAAAREALVLYGGLGMTEDDIDHLHALAYARTSADARERVDSGEAGAAFFMRATPVSQVRDVAAAGENMPPKSTYFYPKVLTGMVFNPLEE